MATRHATIIITKNMGDGFTVFDTISGDVELCDRAIDAEEMAEIREQGLVSRGFIVGYERSYEVTA